MEILKVTAKELGRAASEKEASKLVEQHISKENCGILTQEQILKIKQKYKDIGHSVGIATGKNVAALALEKLDKVILSENAKKAASEAGEKYAVKAREFQKLAMKIAEDAGGQAGDEDGEEEGGEAGERDGGQAGERVGREAGKKAGVNIWQKMQQKFCRF